LARLSEVAKPVAPIEEVKNWRSAIYARQYS
jgi:hypothetical protein